MRTPALQACPEPVAGGDRRSTNDCPLSRRRLRRDARRVEGGADLKAPLTRSADGMSAEGAAMPVPSSACPEPSRRVEGSILQRRLCRAGEADLQAP